MAKWLKALTKTRNAVRGAVRKVFTGSVELDTLEDLEMALIQADVAPRLVAEWVEKLDLTYGGKSISYQEKMREWLLAEFDPTPAFDFANVKPTTCLLMIGVNGAGKTTTCAKLTKRVMDAGKTPILGAADTFRAAGSSQLKVWSERFDAHCVTGQQGADPASVAYDALDAGISRNADLVIVDTAGRMHNRGPLMDELKKMRRALEKRQAGAPHETWIVLDASIGQNALQQAKLFNEALPLTGIIVTKLDGSAKAGFLFSVKRELDVPIRFVGLGEGEDDLVAFNPEEFVDALLGIGESEEQPA